MEENQDYISELWKKVSNEYGYNKDEAYLRDKLNNDEGYRRMFHKKMQEEYGYKPSYDDFLSKIGGQQPAPRVVVSDVEAAQQPQAPAMESPANGTEQAGIPTVTMEQVEVAEEQPQQPAWMPNRMGGVGGEQNYMPQQTSYIERSKAQKEADFAKLVSQYDFSPENVMAEREHGQAVNQSIQETMGAIQGYISDFVRNDVVSNNRNKDASKEAIDKAVERETEKRMRALRKRLADGSLDVDKDNMFSLVPDDIKQQLKGLLEEKDKYNEFISIYNQTPEGIAERKQMIQEQTDIRKEKIDQIKKEQDNNFFTRFAQAQVSADPFMANSESAQILNEVNEDYAEYQAAKRQLRQSIRDLKSEDWRIDGTMQGLGLVKGLALADYESMLPFASANDAMAELGLALDIRDGKELSKGQKALLEAMTLNAETDMLYGGNKGVMERVGSALPEQILFTLKFLIGGELTGATKIAGEVAENAAKRAARRWGEREVSGFTRMMLGRVVPELEGIGAGAFLQTFANTYSWMDIATDVEKRMAGNVYFDENGGLHAFDDGKGFLRAFYQAAASAFVENFTEFMGEDIEKVAKLWKTRPKMMQVAKNWDDIMKQTGLKKVQDLFEIPAEWSRKTGISGSFGEFGEEVFGNIFNALLATEQQADESYGDAFKRTLSQSFSGEQMLETFLSCALMSVAMGSGASAANGLGSADYKRSVAQNTETAKAMLEGVKGLDVEALDAELANGSIRDISKWAKEQSDKNGWTVNEQAAVVNYMMRRTEQAGIEHDESLQIQQGEEQVREQAKGMVNRWDGNNIYNATYQNQDGSQETVQIVNGRVWAKENAEGGYDYNPNLSSGMLAVRFANGSIKQVSSRSIKGVQSVQSVEDYMQQQGFLVREQLRNRFEQEKMLPTMESVFGASELPTNTPIGKYFYKGKDANGNHLISTSADEKGEPTIVSENQLLQLGIAANIDILQQQRTAEALAEIARLREEADYLQTLDETIMTAEQDKTEGSWKAVENMLTRRVKLDEQGGIIPSGSDPKFAAAYMYATARGDMQAAIKNTMQALANKRGQLGQLSTMETENAELGGIAAEQQANMEARTYVTDQISFLEKTLAELQAMAVEEQEDKAEQAANKEVSQMDKDDIFPVEMDGQRYWAQLDGHTVDGPVVSLYDNERAEGEPVDAAIDDMIDEQWEAVRVHPVNETYGTDVTDSQEPPMESAGEGTEQVQPEPQPHQTPEPQPEPAPEQTAMPMRKVKRQVKVDGQKKTVEAEEEDYLAVPAERTYQYLYEELASQGLTEQDANDIVNNNLNEANKTLDEAKKKTPSATGSAAARIAEKQQIEDAIKAAQGVVDYWNAVKAMHDKVVAERIAAQQAAEEERHAQAVAEEEARRAEEERKAREREATGANNVAPNIREKWEGAQRVEGNADEITLANGERIAGHYVLVESGAASASHDALNGFAKTEGFPLDENEQSVNDRDYERDQNAQQITRQIAAEYDSRALQQPVVVSQDGVVLSGNGRTMAGEIAAAQNTDGAYIDYLKKYAPKYGFTPEQVEGMAHPRVVFVPDASMPYTAETFAKFNQQEMKGQSKTEQAVKLGKLVDDATFGRIIRSINRFDTLGDFYADTKATAEAIGELLKAGAINQMQHAEMFDGESISAQSREILENMLIGKAFESNPDAVRQLAAYKSLRQSVITALAEISNNIALGEYSLESELSEAIALAYNARKNGYKAGDAVSEFARQGKLFETEEDATAADYTDATVLMLADLLNDNRVTRLKKAMAVYNKEAQQADGGQSAMAFDEEGNLVQGGVKTKQEILNEVLLLLQHGTESEQQQALDAAVEQRKAAAEQGTGVQGNGDTVESSEADRGVTPDNDRTDGTPSEEVPAEPPMESAGEGTELTPPGPLSEGELGPTDEAVAAANEEVDTNPTEAQKEAGNYKKGHVTIDGFDISIENPAGSTRSGTDAQGNPWSVTMHNSYGYIRMTEGVDGDHIDIFLSDHIDDWNGTVYVVDQVKEDGSFDEHKVMYGFNSAEEAREAYLSNYSEGWQGLGTITGVSREEFKKWVDSSHRKTKAFADYKSVQPTGGKTNDGTNGTDNQAEGTAVEENSGNQEQIEYFVNFTARDDKEKETRRILAKINPDLPGLLAKWIEADNDFRDARENFSIILSDHIVGTKSYEEAKEKVDEKLKPYKDAEEKAYNEYFTTYQATVKVFNELDDNGLKELAELIASENSGNQGETSQDGTAAEQPIDDSDIDALIEDYKKKAAATNKIWSAWLADPSGKPADYGTTRDEEAKAYGRVREALAGVSEEKLAEMENTNYGDSLLNDLIKEERNRRNEQKEIEQRFVDGLAKQGEIGKPTKPVSIEKILPEFTSRDEQRPIMNCIYYDAEGYAVASDAYILIASKSQYDPKQEGKMVAAHKIKGVAEKGDEVEGKFMKWRNVISQAKANSAEIDLPKLRDFLAGVKELMKGSKDDAIVQVRMPNGEIIGFEPEYLLKFVQGAEAMGVKEIEYIAPNRAITGRSEDGIVLLMPKKISADYGGREFYYDLSDKAEDTENESGEDVTDAMKESVMQGQPMFYINKGANETNTEAKEIAYNAVREALANAGIEVVEATEEDVKRLKDSRKQLKDSKGTIRGWVGNDGKIHLTKDGLNAETPIHEYTHLWAEALQMNNPELWEQIKGLLKDTPEWKRITSMKEYSNLKDDDRIAGEVLAHISGKKNAERMEAEAKRMIDEAPTLEEAAKAANLLGRMRDALKKFWTWVGKTLLGKKGNINIDQVSNMVLADLTNGVDPFNPRGGKRTNRAKRTEASIDGEMERIKREAQANGTFMKAPNGKPTKLTERQWLQVRTQALKKWFGDWELAQLIRQAQNAWNDDNSKSKFTFAPSERLAKAYKDILGHEITSIVLTDDAIRHIKNNHGKNEELRGQVNLTPEDIAIIPYVLNNFDTMERSPEHDDKMGNRAVVIKKRINGISIVATIEKGKEKEFVVTNWQFVKSNALDAASATPGPNVRNDFDAAKVRKEIDAIKDSLKNSSKVVDENGEPMVVYHGTGSNFNVFKRGDIGFHFGTSEQAEVAAKNERNPRYIDVYLNIRNPYKIDFDPEEWDVPYNDFMRRLYDDGIIERDEMDSLIMATNSSYRNMKKVRERLLEHGYDGIIYPNWFEFNVGEERRTEFDDSYIAFNPNQIKSATDNNGDFDAGNPDIRFSIDDETDETDRTDVPEMSDEEAEQYDAGRMTFTDIATEGVIKAAEKNKEDLRMRNKAVKAIGVSLNRLRQAMAKQKEYDKATVDSIVRLARMMIENGYMDNMSRSEVKRLMTLAKNATGKTDITKQANAVVDLMLKHQLKAAEAVQQKLLATKGSKVNASGVEVQAGLDITGQRTVKAMKEGIELDEAALTERIADVNDRMGGTDKTLAANAAEEYEGLMMAKDYHDMIRQSEQDEAQLRHELDQAKEDVKNGTLGRKDYKELAARIDAALRKNMADRVTAFTRLNQQLAEVINGSKGRAREFREKQMERVREIQHNANSDMKGTPASEHKKAARINKVVNSGIVRFLFKPVATFDEMLRFFGKKSVDGMGYLWQRFMGGYIDAADTEWRSLKKDHDALDEKVSEVMGEKMRWSDLFSMERKMKPIEVEFYDTTTNENGEAVRVKEKHPLTQGNALYIYMVNKMDDGAMKLRRMGITDEDVDRIAGQLDPRFLQLADWIQDEFLPKKREAFNAVHMRMFGAPMAAIEEYFPLVTNSRSRGKDEDISEHDKGETKPSTITGSIIKRTVNTTPLDVTNADAFDVLLGHLRDMEHWAAFAELNRDMNTLLSYKRFKNQVLNTSSVRFGAGETLWNNFKDVCAIAADVYHPKVNAQSLDNAIVNISKGVTSSKISFRLYTALKQLLSYPAYFSEANPIELAKSMGRPAASFNWALDNLPGFAERWQSRQAGDSRLKDTDADWDFWKNKFVDTARRWGMTPNAFVDGITVAMGAKAIYESKLKGYMKAGYSEAEAKEKALKEASAAVNETQQSSQNAYLSAMQLDRTVASVALTVFRNASMGYERRLLRAVDNIKRKFTKGYKEESIEFMRKKMVREGLTEEQAKAASERAWNISIAKDVANVVIFGYVMQLAWNLGSNLIYLVFGDDDDEKGKMWEDAAMHALAGPVEGLSGGSVISEVYNMARSGKKISNYNFQLLPIMSDLQTTMKHMEQDKVRGIQDIVNLVIQAGVGVNPQTITDAAVAIVDAADGDLGVGKEIGMLLLRIAQVPQSQLDQLYIDELGMSAKDAKALPMEELAQRYAAYKRMKDAPLTGWAYSDEAKEKVDKRYVNRFVKLVQERVANMDDEALERNMDGDDPMLKKQVGKEVAGRLEGKDTYGNQPQSNWKEETKKAHLVYQQLRGYVDLCEDVVLQKAQADADKAYEAALEEGKWTEAQTQQMRAKGIEQAREQLNKMRRQLGQGNGQYDQQIMENISAMRSRYMEYYGLKGKKE